MTEAMHSRRAFDTPDLTSDLPVQWLKRGWADFRANMIISLVYGGVFAAASIVLVFGLYALDLHWVILPAAAGFTIVGPLMAMGLYEVSRCRSAGEPVRLGAVAVVKTRNPIQVGFMAVLLMIGFMVWIRVAMINYALFFGLIEFPAFAETFALLATPKGIGMLSVGTFLGALFAIIAFSITAFSLPAFLNEALDTITAMVRSAAVVRYNPMVAFKWAIIVSIGTMIGFATGFIGFTVVFPILGYATWHAYSDTLAKQTAP